MRQSLIFKNEQIIRDHPVSENTLEVYIEKTHETFFTYQAKYIKNSIVIKTHEFKVEAMSVGQSNLCALNWVMQSLKKFAEKTVCIFINSDYVVSVVQKIPDLHRRGKIESANNAYELQALKNLMDTVGRSHYITVRTKKVLRPYLVNNSGSIR